MIEEEINSSYSSADGYVDLNDLISEETPIRAPRTKNHRMTLKTHHNKGYLDE